MCSTEELAPRIGALLLGQHTGSLILLAQLLVLVSSLADYFGVAIDELFPAQEAGAPEKPPATAEQSDHAIIAHHLAGELAGLFAGGQLSDQDKEAVMRSLERAYWLSHPDEKRPE